MTTQFAKDMQKRWDEFDKGFDEEKLRDEMTLMMKQARYENKDIAQASDQFETPPYVKQKIARRYNLRPSAIWDPFEFNGGWNNKFYYDGFEEDWPTNK